VKEIQEIRETDLEYTTLKINITFEEALDISCIQLQSLHSNKKSPGKIGFAQAIWDQPIPTKTSSGSWKSNAP